MDMKTVTVAVFNRSVPRLTDRHWWRRHDQGLSKDIRVSVALTAVSLNLNMSAASPSAAVLDHGIQRRVRVGATAVPCWDGDIADKI